MSLVSKLLVLLVIAAAGFLMVVQRLPHVTPASAQDGDATSTADPEASVLVLLGRHLVVPTSTPPIMTTVQDVSSLAASNPSAYGNAQDGDVVLAWPGEVVVYSPSRDRIVSVTTPAAPDVTACTRPSGGSATSTMSLEIRNGSGTVGVAKALATQLTSDVLPGIVVLPSKPSTANGVYAQTFVAVRPGINASSTLAELAKYVNFITLSTWPAAETGVKGDILLMLGTDFSP